MNLTKALKHKKKLVKQIDEMFIRFSKRAYSLVVKTKSTSLIPLYSFVERSASSLLDIDGMIDTTTTSSFL